MKDLDISVEKNMMVIKGQRPDPHENPNKKYFCQECWWGPFSRKIVLPENIETEEASAQIDKGLLTIKIPKAGDQKKNVEVS
jgi:HSP20 family protein